jgi:hypothetical protein
MSKKLLQFVAAVGLLCSRSRFIHAQEKPVEVRGCDLARDPRAFDGKLLRVRGTLNVEFEDFSLGIRNCETKQGIWLAFGGDVPGIVASTMNDSFRKAGSDLAVNGVSYSIKKDDGFHKLYALIAGRHRDKPDYVVTATLTGMFFAGEESKTANGTVDFVGYGHLGCCSLLVITEVSAVESDPTANLNLHGVLIGVDGKPVEGFTVIDDVLGGNPPERQKTVTNREGEFVFSKSGQELRIENPNYRPLALTVEPGGAPVQVRLEDAKDTDWVITSCGKRDSSRRVGYSVLFALPKTMESKPFSCHYRDESKSGKMKSRSRCPENHPISRAAEPGEASQCAGAVAPDGGPCASGTRECANAAGESGPRISKVLRRTAAQVSHATSPSSHDRCIKRGIA